MALINFDGFDTYANNTDFQSAGYTALEVAIAPGRFTGTSLNINTTTGYVRQAYPDKDDNYFGFAFNYDSTASSGVFFYGYNNAGTATFNLFIDTATRQISIRIANSTTKLATSTTIVQPNTWYYIEVRAFNGSPDTVELKINGITEFTVSTGFSFLATGPHGFGFNVNNQAACSNFRIDDFWRTDALGTSNIGFIGERRVEVLRPSADGQFVNFQSNVGPGADLFDAVDDISPDYDTTYVFSDIQGDAATFTTLDTLINNPQSISGVKIENVMRKDDTGPRNAVAVINNGGTLIESNEFPLTTDYRKYDAIYEIDPRTGLAWDRTGVEGLEFGFKISL